jgi:hypothetical protein
MFLHSYSLFLSHIQQILIFTFLLVTYSIHTRHVLLSDFQDGIENKFSISIWKLLLILSFENFLIIVFALHTKIQLEGICIAFVWTEDKFSSLLRAKEIYESLSWLGLIVYDDLSHQGFRMFMEQFAPHITSSYYYVVRAGSEKNVLRSEATSFYEVVQCTFKVMNKSGNSLIYHITKIYANTSVTQHKHGRLCQESKY